MSGTNQPKVLVIAFSPLHRDPRVLRQVRALEDVCAVTAAGFTTTDLPGVEFIRLDPRTRKTPRQRLVSKSAVVWRALTHGYLQYYWRQPNIRFARNALTGRRFDMVVANDIETLPLALEIAAGAPVLFDAHEYAPLQYHGRKARLLDTPYKLFLCREFIPRASAFITVAEGIARQYQSDTGVRASVVTNAPEYFECGPILFDCSVDNINIIHHGGAMRGRRLEILVDMMALLDERFHLTLMLVPTDGAYFEFLKRRAAGLRVTFRPPVSFGEIVDTLRAYDLGVAFAYPSCFNNRHSLPNKFFEFVQARLAVVAGPSPEMGPIIRERGLGVVADDFTPQALARAIGALTVSAINGYKRNADQSARELSAERNMLFLQSIARRLLGQDKD